MYTLAYYISIELSLYLRLLIYHIVLMNIRSLEELGTGEFGVVTHGKWKPSTNKEVEVAVKMLNTDASDKDRLRFLQEAAIMCQFDHQNVIKLHGVVTETPAMIVLEYMSHGNLRNLLLEQQQMSVKSKLTKCHVTDNNNFAGVKLLLMENFHLSY